MAHPADAFIKRYDGPVALAAGCTLCKHTDRTIKPPRGRAGRGWGMREGNKLRGRMIQHVKAEHPTALKERTT